MKKSLAEFKQVCEDTEKTFPTIVVKGFPEGLGDRMDAFDTKVTPFAKASSPMEDKEATDVYAENTRAQKMTADFEKDAIAKGDENQVVKKKMIQ